MKTKFINIFLLVVGLMLGACSDNLNTEPTTSTTSEVVFRDVTSAQTAMNGIYRYMYTAGWSVNWSAENCGLSGILLTADLMGEDHLMADPGQGWFWYDYCLDVQMDYTHTSGHPYAFWNFFYTSICNINYILATENTLPGDPAEVKKLMAQAYAMRAMCYHYLIQIYQQTYVGNEDAAGVPIYTEPTTKETIGKPRGTIKDTYLQINADINKAITLFEEVGIESHEHASHIDYYVANGFKARICMTQNLYADAEQAATEALKAPYARVATVNEMKGMNNITMPNVLWGMEVIAEQGSGFEGFFSHMDADAEGLYASSAQKCIDASLYSRIPQSDERKGWFRGKLEKDGEGSNFSYCQLKFKMANYSNRIGDIIYMRYEEMLLIKAEAQCMQDKYSDARLTLTELLEQRDANYAEMLNNFTDSKNYNSDTNGRIVSLMDGILLQRRIELWGEVGRLFDLKRLGLGYNRDYEGSNQTTALATDPGDLRFVLPLPQSEIDGNVNISDEDNNPLY
ncbi:RagB/SusD family nutrient uptake outer membrane protein [Parabacteroides sp. AM08-6]|uniref:RagB/SusD family nutrient uptake outer membrane protein n=1 Tax=Parabacteroides sp. AM08-6 TaxID=2292053 RepID=UPI000F000563|nr:RagB/SusD family nutrient uptake outer membrane protein [Parabacteroides sp. AM08-6]RHJ85407.1 RagB/SusD family nutrient uptake outer membrane protein [Parabacteroides sp. AM08-6]